MDTARATGEEGVQIAGDLPQSVVTVWGGVVLGAVVLEDGDPARAEELLLGSTGGEKMELIPGAWRTNWLEVLTRCEVELGNHAAAARAAESARAWATECGLPLGGALADRAEARVALDAGEAETATELALASAAGAEEVGARVEAAFARALAGRALMDAGDADGAAAELERAAAAFDACGAERYRNQAERELGKLGRRAHRRTAAGSGEGSGVDSLTGRELEVAQLVVDRRTNPEIASELFLSVKTVETHMRNIFRKLDVGSRVEVARVVESHSKVT
jgi:DNA-binding NarL/FixJ family response regulator